MVHAYTEDQLVEQPAIKLFRSLGWQTISALEETFGTAGTLGRETKGEVVLVDRLRVALTKLNPGVFADAIQTAIDGLARDRSAMSPEAASREVYKRLDESYSKKWYWNVSKPRQKRNERMLTDCCARKSPTQSPRSRKRPSFVTYCRKCVGKKVSNGLAQKPDQK